MPRPKWLIVFLFLGGGLCANRMDRPATLEKCRDDYKLWTAPDLSLSKKEWSIEVLNAHAKEMLYCETAYRDDDSAERMQWVTLENQFFSGIQGRYMDFVDRHGLSSLFLEEDAKGER